MEEEQKQQNLQQQQFDFLFVLDFEATCIKDKKINPQEIIEFPVVPYDLKTNKIWEDKIFHFYIKPKVNPELSDFCKDLTKITQKQVDEGIYLEDALLAFDDFLTICGLQNKKFTFVTCGDFDLNLLKRECQFKNITLKKYFDSYINIKQAFPKNLQPKNFQDNIRGVDMVNMLKFLKLQLIGTHHSGIDDSKNIARICQCLINNHNFVFEQDLVKSCRTYNKAQNKFNNRFGNNYIPYNQMKGNKNNDNNNTKKSDHLKQDQNQDEEQKQQQQQQLSVDPSLHDYDYLLVLDFEATCEKDIEMKNREIIEFPVVPYDLRKNQIWSENLFHHYIKPTINPKLTNFCTELTGITQQQVDKGIDIGDCIKLLDDYMVNCNFLKKKFVFVTVGNFDLNQLNEECYKKGIKTPNYLDYFIDIKFQFPRSLYPPQKKKGRLGMKRMIQQLGLKLEGSHHSGIDDSKNTARICKELVDKHGFTFIRKMSKKVFPL